MANNNHNTMESNKTFTINKPNENNMNNNMCRNRLLNNDEEIIIDNNDIVVDGDDKTKSLPTTALINGDMNKSIQSPLNNFNNKSSPIKSNKLHVVVNNSLYNNVANEEEIVELLDKHRDDDNSRRVQFDNENNKTNQSISQSNSVTTDDDDDDDEDDDDSTNNSSSSESLDIHEARPPDGGWGWVVVAASFVVNLIADGITFSFGVIFVEFLKYFGQNRGTTAWIGGLFMAMPLLSGPIASFLTDRYGCRQVTIYGAIMATIGFIISSRANSMTVLCITFGILAGFGLSLCYVSSVVIVAYYFDKKRSFATGLAVCGSGIGTFIFAPLIQILLDEYGWRGTTLILAGLFFNLVVCGALMRDLPWTSEKQKTLAKERKRNRNLKRKNKNSSADSFSVSNSTNTASVLQPILELPENDTTNSMENTNRLCSSLVNLPTYVCNGEKVPLEVLELLSQHRNFYNVLMVNYPNLLTPSKSFSDSGRLHAQTQIELNSPPSHQQQQQQQQQPTSNKPEEPKSSSMKPLNNVDSQYLWWLKRNQISPPTVCNNTKNNKFPAMAFLRDLRIHRLSVTYRGAMLNINRYRLRASSCPDIYRNSMTTIAKEKGQWYAGLWDLWDLLVDMFDFSHFTDTKFLIFAISNFLLYTWYDVPYVYLTDYAIRSGYKDTDASMLISIIGIINMKGEIILGWIGDRSWANASLIYGGCMGLCGAITALIPLVHSYWSLCFLSGAFGFLIAANYSLTCIILVELITLERFTNAYGLLLLVQGVANLIGPPLAGWLYDITGTYDLPFYLAGLFIGLSGIMLIVLPLINHYKSYMSRQTSSESSLPPNSQQQNENTGTFFKLFSICLNRSREKPSTDTVSHI